MIGAGNARVFALALDGAGRERIHAVLKKALGPCRLIGDRGDE